MYNLNDSDKAKIKYEKRLALRNTIFDKLILGALILGLGLSANYYLENYKSNLTKKQIETETLYREKMRIVSLLEESQIKIFNDYIDVFLHKEKQDDSVKVCIDRFSLDLIKSLDTLAAYSHLFSNRYCFSYNEIIRTYFSMGHLDASKWSEYFDFFKFINTFRLELNKAELGVPSSDSTFLSFEMVDYAGEDYWAFGKLLKMNYNNWLQKYHPK